MATLTEIIVEAHRASGTPGGWARGAAADCVVDHVLVGDRAAGFVLSAFEAAGERVPRVECAVVWTRPRTLAPAHVGEEDLHRLLEQAQACGIQSAHTVHGACDPAYRERGAAPGRLAAAVRLGEMSAGALGCLVLPVGGLEAAATMAGRGPRVEPRPVVGVDLEGTLPSGACGADVALRLAARLEASGLLGSIIEFTGAGVASLPMADRIAVAGRLTASGAAAVLFPSDECTRHYLRACGREPDWREIAPTAASAYDRALAFNLDAVAPQVASADDPLVVRPVHQVVGRPISRIVVGPLCDEEDIARMAAVLHKRPAHVGVAVEILPGSGAMFDSLEARGIAAELRGAGAVVLEPTAARDLRRPSEREGAWLSWGLPVEEGEEAQPLSCVAGPLVCAASALFAQLADPSILDLPPVSEEGVVRMASPERLEERFTTSRIDRGEAPPAPAAVAGGRAGRSGLRLDVWVDAGDDASADRILSSGARRSNEGPSGVAPGEALFRGLERAFEPDAGGERRLVVVAGRRFGGGSRADEAAWALSRAGVGAIVVESFGEGARRALVLAGVLGLELSDARARGQLRPGDEIEMPNLPEAAEPARPLVVRNLTRGQQHVVHHGLDAWEIAVWRAGGILARGQAGPER